jgi:hypothetical protein
VHIPAVRAAAWIAGLDPAIDVFTQSSTAKAVPCPVGTQDRTSVKPAASSVSP